MPDIADPQHIPAPAVQRQDREVLIDEARRQHYGDQPMLTSALTGGAIGALAPPVLAALMDYQGFKANPGRTLPMSLVAAPVMAAAGMGTEALGRLLARSLGPGFDRRRWHRDQDPHRLNPALRLAPLGVALLAGRALPSIYQQVNHMEQDNTPKTAPTWLDRLAGKQAASNWGSVPVSPNWVQPSVAGGMPPWHPSMGHIPVESMGRYQLPWNEIGQAGRIPQPAGALLDTAADVSKYVEPGVRAQVQSLNTGGNSTYMSNHAGPGAKGTWYRTSAGQQMFAPLEEAAAAPRSWGRVPTADPVAPRSWGRVPTADPVAPRSWGRVPTAPTGAWQGIKNTLAPVGRALAPVARVVGKVAPPLAAADTLLSARTLDDPVQARVEAGKDRQSWNTSGPFGKALRVAGAPFNPLRTSNALWQPGEAHPAPPGTSPGLGGGLKQHPKLFQAPSASPSNKPMTVAPSLTQPKQAAILPKPERHPALEQQGAHIPVVAPPLRRTNWKTLLKGPGQFDFRTPNQAPAIKAPDASAVVPTGAGQPKMAASKTPAELKALVQAAEAQVREPKSDKQRESGAYPKGHVRLHGLDITLETASGMTRSGTAKDGTKWSIELKDPYGYIKGTDSAEPGDQMDVFIGPHPEIEMVFVVDQNKHGTKTFDEVKVVMGVRTSREARELYERNYSPGWDGFRSVTPLTIPQFKSWCERGDMTKPLAGQQFQDFHKTASRRDDEERKRRKAPYKVVQDALPWLGGLSLAGAGASEILRRGAFTPALQDDMRDFSRKIESDNLFKPYAHLPQDEQAMQAMADYAIQGNKLLNNRLWGFVSPASIIKTLRSLPGVVKPQDRWTPDSAQHYDAFEASPASGMVRVLGELSQGGWRREDGTSSPGLPDPVRDSLRKAVNNVAGLNYADTKGGNAGWNFPAIGMPSQLSRDQQLQMMRKVGPELKSEVRKLPDGEALWRQFTDNIRSGRNTVYEGYGKLTGALQNVNSSWAGLNTALLGTGAASLGGLALWRYLDKRKREQQRKREHVTP